jgi:phosphatidylserine/phosphatidylglycerophosphate/cardiolipin synthase-like enzyme
MDIPEKLLNHVIGLANEISVAQAERIFSVLSPIQTPEWDYLRLALQNCLPPIFNLRIHKLIDLWIQEAPQMPPQALAVGVLTAALAGSSAREEHKFELVWTGPESQTIPLRRTDQVLYDLIGRSQHSLWIVSFAVYRIHKIIQAIKESANRGTRVSLLLESEEESQGRLSFDLINRLRQEFSSKVTLYTWPLEQRTLSLSGIPGLLHAKIAVADSNYLFISSANLTDLALQANMEMGVIITGIEPSSKVEMLFEEMVARREICAVG